MRAPLGRTLAGLCWAGGEGVTIGRMLVAGALVWTLYSVTSVLVNGPVLDEAVEAGQVVAAQVTYPAGHPHRVFYRRAFSLSYQLAGLTLGLEPNVWAVSASRNVLFLFCSTFVPFSLGLLLTRRPAWGHVASVLVLSETACSFVGVYLMWVFPGFYSSGHLGIHAALLVGVLLVAGRWRTGGFLLGLLPAIHLSMALVVWPWSACYLLLARNRPAGCARALPWIVLGLAACGALALTIHIRTNGDRVEPPYDVTEDARVIVRTFRTTTDPHRQPIRIASAAYLVAPTAFLSLGALLVRRRRSADTEGSRPDLRADRLWILLMGALAWAYVYGTRLVQAVAGSLPEPVEASMPGRFANLAALFLLPMTVAVIADAARASGRAARPIVTGVACALVLVEAGLLLVDRIAAYRYFIYVAWGAMFALARATDGERRALVVAALVAVAAAMGFLRLSGADPGVWPLVTAFVAASVLFAGGRRLAARWRQGDARPGRAAEVVLVCICCLAAAAALPGPHVMGLSDAGSERLSDDDRALVGWLTRSAAPDEMLVTPLWPPTLLQAKTGHPMLVEVMTLLTMTYVPSLAPAVGTIVRDLFGIDYSRPEQVRLLLGPDGMLRPTSPVWLDAWQKRTCREWQQLGERYRFRLVVSPQRAPLDLPVALPGRALTLYTVPSGSGCADGAG